MSLNLGYIDLGGGGDGIDVRVYYDTSWLASNPDADPDQAALVNGPRGYCLDLTNTSGSNIKVTVYGLSSNPQTFNVGQGDPVAKGQAKSLTAAQMASLGFTTRGNVGEIELDF